MRRAGRRHRAAARRFRSDRPWPGNGHPRRGGQPKAEPRRAQQRRRGAAAICRPGGRRGLVWAERLAVAGCLTPVMQEAPSWLSRLADAVARRSFPTAVGWLATCDPRPRSGAARPGPRPAWPRPRLVPRPDHGQPGQVLGPAGVVGGRYRRGGSGWRHGSRHPGMGGTGGGHGRRADRKDPGRGPGGSGPGAAGRTCPGCGGGRDRAGARRPGPAACPAAGMAPGRPRGDRGPRAIRPRRWPPSRG